MTTPLKAQRFFQEMRSLYRDLEIPAHKRSKFVRRLETLARRIDITDGPEIGQAFALYYLCTRSKFGEDFLNPDSAYSDYLFEDD